MLVETHKIRTEYVRHSKKGKLHTYSRYKIVIELKCDSCGSVFLRDKGNIEPKRISNNYLHVCSKCNPKKFAQKIGASNRNFWNIPADSDIDITKL